MIELLVLIISGLSIFWMVYNIPTPLFDNAITWQQYLTSFSFYTPNIWFFLIAFTIAVCGYKLLGKLGK